MQIVAFSGKNFDKKIGTLVLIRLYLRCSQGLTEHCTARTWKELGTRFRVQESMVEPSFASQLSLRSWLELRWACLIAINLRSMSEYLPDEARGDGSQPLLSLRPH